MLAPLPQPHGKSERFFLLYRGGGHFATFFLMGGGGFSPCGGLLATFFTSLWEPFSLCKSLFCFMGGLFEACPLPPPPPQIFLRVPMLVSRVKSISSPPPPSPYIRGLWKCDFEGSVGFCDRPLVLPPSPPALPTPSPPTYVVCGSVILRDL